MIGVGFRGAAIERLAWESFRVPDIACSELDIPWPICRQGSVERPRSPPVPQLPVPFSRHAPSGYMHSDRSLMGGPSSSSCEFKSRSRQLASGGRALKHPDTPPTGHGDSPTTPLEPPPCPAAGNFPGSVAHNERHAETRADSERNSIATVYYVPLEHPDAREALEVQAHLPLEHFDAREAETVQAISLPQKHRDAREAETVQAISLPQHRRDARTLQKAEVAQTVIQQCPVPGEPGAKDLPSWEMANPETVKQGSMNRDYGAFTTMATAGCLLNTEDEGQAGGQDVVAGIVAPSSAFGCPKAATKHAQPEALGRRGHA